MRGMQLTRAQAFSKLRFSVPDCPLENLLVTSPKDKVGQLT